MDTSKNGFREREGVNSFTYRGRARGRVKGQGSRVKGHKQRDIEGSSIPL